MFIPNLSLKFIYYVYFQWILPFNSASNFTIFFQFFHYAIPTVFIRRFKVSYYAIWRGNINKKFKSKENI